MILTHYIIARRDLTVGDLVAQLAHAAGESFFLFYAQVRLGPSASSRGVAGLIPAEGATLIPGRLEKERPSSNGNVAGSSPAPGTHVIDIGT